MSRLARKAKSGIGRDKKKPGSKDEPFRSSLTDGKRVEIVKRLVSGNSEPNDAGDFLSDFARAVRKGAAADTQAQMEQDGNVLLGPFEYPDKSSASATATQMFMQPTLEMLLADGDRKRRSRRRGTDNASKQRAERAKPFIDAVVSKWQAMTAAGVPKRERAGKIAMAMGVTPKHIRQIVKKANLT
jgi:hypothetical protein